MVDANAITGCPKISVITPSFNQGLFLERTIKSVLDQNYPNLQYMIIDGGSTDNSVSIIKKYESSLYYWVSEPDQGQADAINKGLRRATGEWIAWQNSDDIYYPGVFNQLAKTAELHPEVGLIIGNMMLIDAEDRTLRDLHYVRPTYHSMVAEGMVLANQAAFWRRSLHERIGYLDEHMNYSLDYEWFLRVTRVCRTYHVNRMWGGFRIHNMAKTSSPKRMFVKENQLILAKELKSRGFLYLFRLRRMLLLLAQGDFLYVLRGLLLWFSGKRGPLG
jgi:glycosyltransferase involved in cell wall biosynthesis